jgi:hypothetical protein
VTKPQPLEIFGQRLLVGCADTGIFRIVDIGGRATNREPARAARATADAFAFATIETGGPLAVVDLNHDSNPYRRHGRQLR